MNDSGRLKIYNPAMTLYFISHTIQAFLLPPGLFILLGLGGLFLLSRFAKLSKALLFCTFLGLWIFSTPFVAQKLIDSLQLPYPPLALDDLNDTKAGSAIVVLGGGAGIAPEYADQHFVSDSTLRRVHYAAYLARKTKLPIIVSGGGTDELLFTEANLMQTILQNDFKLAVFLKEDKSMTTLDEAYYLAPMLQQRKIKTIYLVTHAWHMARSLIAFRQTGLAIIPAPMGYISLEKEDGLLEFLPLMNALSVSTVALHEYVGMAWYLLH